MGEIWWITVLTVAMATAATILILPAGLLLAWALSRGRFPGRVLLETLVSLPLVMPPVATGLVLLFLLLCEMGFSLRTSLGAVALTGVATPLWQAARDSFSEPLGGLGMVGYLYFARRGAWFRAGAFVGLVLALGEQDVGLAGGAAGCGYAFGVGRCGDGDGGSAEGGQAEGE